MVGVGERETTVSILVVEDEPAIGQLIHDVLAVDGYRVVTAAGPEQAAAAAASMAPHLFIIDMMLPGISGIELAAQLREEGFPDTPAIAISGSLLMSEIAEESGLFQAVLSKPIDFDELIAEIDRATGTP